MSWLRLDDKFTRHRKVASLTDAEFRLHVTALSHAAEFETDGRISTADLSVMPSLPRGVKLQRAIKNLIKSELWHDDGDGGWQLHDFLDWNPSRESQNAKRAAARERMRAVRVDVRANDERTSSEVSTKCDRSSPAVLAGARGGAIGRAGSGSGSDLDLRSGSASGKLCPADLTLTEDQIANAEMSLGAARWQVEAMCRALVGRWCDGMTRRPSEAHWRRQLWVAFSVDWKDPSKRPTKPEPTAAERAARNAAADAAWEALVARESAERAGKAPETVEESKAAVEAVLASARAQSARGAR